MDSTKLQNGLKEASHLSQRLLKAYKRISPNLRPLAARAFCEAHHITDKTFRAKRTGQEGYAVTESEIEWMESYNPYAAQPVTA